MQRNAMQYTPRYRPLLILQIVSIPHISTNLSIYPTTINLYVDLSTPTPTHVFIKVFNVKIIS